MQILSLIPTSIIPFCILLLAAIIELTKESNSKNIVKFNRGFAITTSILVLISLFLLTSSDRTLMIFSGSENLLILGAKNSKSNTNYSSMAHWGYIFACAQMLIFLISSLVCPKIPIVQIKMSRIYLIQAVQIAMSLSININQFIVLAIFCYLILILSVNAHSKSLENDPRMPVRVRTFSLYHSLTVFCLLGALLINKIGVNLSPSVEMLALVFVAVASFTAIGLFPFHSWLVPFIGSPRNTTFLPMFVIQSGLLILYRLYIPLCLENPLALKAGIGFSMIGLVYGTLLLFNEKKLKRIPGYLYITHVCLIVLSIHGLGEGGQLVSVLDGLNILVSLMGLVSVAALLTSRFGAKGVISPKGLASNFPELGICYLLCALSLVGFPGTLGFIEEEIMIESGLEQSLFIISVIALVFTLNGFSCFRLFAKVFFGEKSELVDADFQLLKRERLAIVSIILLLLVNGIFPKAILALL